MTSWCNDPPRKPAFEDNCYEPPSATGHRLPQSDGVVGGTCRAPNTLVLEPPTEGQEDVLNIPELTSLR